MAKGNPRSQAVGLTVVHSCGEMLACAWLGQKTAAELGNFFSLESSLQSGGGDMPLSLLPSVYFTLISCNW